MKKTIMSLALASLFAVSAQAEGQIKMVGSSTVFPFASAVAEQFGATGGGATPVVESTGTGGGMKLFCAGNGPTTPDITNASRRMKAVEFETCSKNGVNNITEVMFGYDGIVLAQSKKAKAMNLTRKQIFMAIAKEIPSADGKSLIPNPNKTWNQIDASLPNKPITVYGPPKSSGTRDSFEEMVMQHFTKKGEFKDAYHAAGHKKYSTIRTDGAWVDSGENDNLIVQKLGKNTNAIGVFGYSYLEENANKLVGANVDGKAPTAGNISSGAYPISRTLYFYIKNDNITDKPSIKKYATLFTSDKMIGQRGSLKRLGLIPLSNAMRAGNAKRVEVSAKMTSAGLK
ncbi:MAG: phosphate-binding protein [Sulfurovum sp. AS07-7]|nr:MAG: phosphate-binding protein [Sulfurovum sp. AS07-7]